MTAEAPSLYASLAGLGAVAAVVLLTGPLAVLAQALAVARRARGIRAATRPQDAMVADRILRSGDAATDLWLARAIPGAAWLRRQLEAAGDPWPLRRLVAGLSAIAVALAIGLGLAGLPAVVAGAAGAALALLAGWQGIGWLARRRRERFRIGFPDAIGLMVRALRAGLPVAAAVHEVARAVPGPIGDEFRRVSEEMRLGLPIETALWGAARRVRLADFDFLVVTVSVQREAGGNLAETLAGLDDTLRRRAQLHLKVHAVSAEARTSALIIGSLPFVIAGLMALIAPDYLGLLFATPLGRLLAGAALASIATGGMMIGRMARIEP